MEIDTRRLVQGLVGAFLIAIGLIMTEQNFEEKKNKWAGGILFILGWVIFLTTQTYPVVLVGLFVPIIAMFGQLYFHYIRSLPMPNRRKLVWSTSLIWLLFISVWVVYCYFIARGNTPALIMVYVGLFLLMGGMMGYFLRRKTDAYELTGGLVPRVDHSTSIFSPFVVMVAFGWVLLAIANALT